MGLNYTESLLMQILINFKKKLFKLWESVIESNDRFDANASDTNNSIASTSIPSDAAMVCNTVEDGYMTYIKILQGREGNKSFKVPLPITSGGSPLIFERLFNPYHM